MTGGSFQHDVAGGGGNLVVTSMQSPNFVAGSTGWQIRKDGNVEFNSGVFRGTVTASTFQGTDFIINSAGMFFYNGVPAAGNLAASYAQTSGIDGFGNNYRGPGFYVYSGTGSWAVLNSASVTFNTGDASQIDTGSVTSGIAGTGTTRSLFTGMASPKLGGSDRSSVNTGSGSADAITQGAYVELFCQDSLADLYVGSVNNAPGVPTILVTGGIYTVNGNTPRRISVTPLSLLAGFSAAAGELVPSVFLNPMNGGQLVFAGGLKLPAAGAYNAVTFATLPVGLFSPNTAFNLPSTPRRCPVLPLSQTAFAGAGQPGPPRLFMDTSGNLSLAGIASAINSTVVDITGTIPLN